MSLPGYRALFEKVLKKLNLEGYPIVEKPITTAKCYVTYVTRAQVETNKFIIKCGTQDENMRSVISMHKYFDREIFVYCNIFPEFRKLQIEKNVDEVFDCYPQIYDCVNEPNNEIIVLDDMASRGYRSVSESDTFDLAHVTAALKAYARFHALSFALRDQKKEVFESLSQNVDEYYFNECTREFRCLFSKCCVRALDSLDSVNDGKLYASVAKAFVDFPNVMERVFVNQSSNEYSVFTQVDCRLTNLVFKYKEDGTIDHAGLLDWQLLTLASPVVDVLYVIFVNTTKDLRDKHFMDLIRHYYVELSLFLCKLGCDPERLFTFKTLIDDMKKYGAHILLLSTITLYSILETAKDKPLNDNHFDVRMRDVAVDCYNLDNLERAPQQSADKLSQALDSHTNMVSDTENLTAVLYGINDLRLEQRPIPEPKDDEVLLKMEVVGICGSDVHYLVHGRIGPFVVEKPMVIGHEASGTVVKVGKCVKHLKPGDRVAIEPGVGCRKCCYCREGRYNLCPDMGFCATPPYDGNLARYYVHAADFCFKLPDHVSLEEGALLEPLSVGVHACKRGNVGIGDVVLVLGAGPIGLVTLLTAKAFGASKVIIMDLVQSRLDTAKILGADHTVLVDSKMPEQDVIKKIVDTVGCQPSKSIDCVGFESTVRVAVQATRSGGMVVFVGLGQPNVNFPISDLLLREVDVRGVFRYVNDYPTALELVATGKVNVKPLITHNFKMEDTLAAFHTSKTGEGNAIKVLIHANPEWSA
ncbi:hypothetical protein FQR65_LT06937 [Abscondita terminalis]|nr:hypothetical protein FQR65_LT06937 [Abscondita terminalis]